MSKYLSLLVTADFYALDKGIQERIYQEFYMLVYPMIYFILRDHSGVEDLIQESFIRALRKASMLNEKEKYEAWLKKLTRNVTLNHLRKIKKNPVDLKSAHAAENMLLLEKEVELKLMREAIVQYIHQLNPDYRQIIAMKWIDNLSYKEMASELGITEGSVRQRLYRARETVRLRLMKEWGNPLE